MMSMMSSWISLNRTEKNSRDIIENLVLQTENQIIYESNNWNSTSESKKEEGDKKDEDQKE
jgi:cbb3-type cytochrome oxidase cytochrome c subunit